MATQEKNQLGDGSDNYAGAAKQAANAAKSAKEAGKTAAKETAKKGAEATSRAAAATVKASVEGGKAAAQIAAGTAAGGPVGAAISIAWSMRHTLFKILICVCLSLTFLIVMIVSLPSIIMDSIFGTNGTQPVEGVTITSVYDSLVVDVSNAVENGYNTSMSKVENIIRNGGYDYETSMAATINYAQSSAGYDVSYILSAYSASLQQKNTSKDDMINKLNAVAGKMFPVTYEVKTTTVTETSDDGTSTERTVTYAECTIHPFDNNVIAEAFSIDLDANYGNFSISYRDAISNMANSLKMTLYGSLGGGEGVPLTDAELIDFVNKQNCTQARKQLLTTGLALVGKVPYFWGGKSGPGWNDEWNTPKVVTAAGSSSTGTIRPYGLDCSGFTTWVYQTALGVYIGDGTSGQYPKTSAVSASDLQIGDLGFLANSGGGDWNHVLMFAGYGDDGSRMWVHSSGGSGVILNTPSYEASLVLRRPNGVDYNMSVSAEPSGTGLYTLEVEVTHYCSCYQCNGNTLAKTASGKPLADGMVAMSSNYPFGTQLMINGKLYTVEDRGGSEIENNIHRVDIYVPNHQQALNLGRFKTTATVYRIGR